MTQVDVEITTAFATPLVTVALPDSESLNRALTELFLQKEREGDKYRTPVHIPTQIGDIFESTFDLFDWPDEPVQRLARGCPRILREYVAPPNKYSEAGMHPFPFHYHAWFHITRRGGYQSIHYLV